MSGVKCIWITAAFLLVEPSWARAQGVFPSTPSKTYTGRSNFVFVGASLTENQGLSNGVNCLKSSAAATVFQSDLPARPRLISATLYIGGSLIDENVNGNDNIFNTTASTTADLEVEAKVVADRSVNFLPPGATAPITVTASREPAVLVFPRTGGQAGNFAAFVTPIDVTDAIANQGHGVLAGDYSVSDLLADVCYGHEVNCDSPATCGAGGNQPCTCANNPNSAVDPNGAASFALLLVVEDPSLPLRNIATFDGLVTLSSSDAQEQLDLPSPVSKPAAGSLAFYALEGDLSLPGNATASGPPCNSGEYILVQDDAPGGQDLCLEDDDNLRENIFNASINVQPDGGAADFCAGSQLFNCCGGDGLCNVVGVDIDRFDISPALTPDATQVQVRIRSGNDRIFFATLVLGIDVYEPLLTQDTQIRVLNADDDGNVQVGTEIIYSVAISNTGNFGADAAHVSLDSPDNTFGLRIIALPEGATDNSSVVSGHLDISGFTVPAGEIAEVRFGVTTLCQIDNSTNTAATVSAAAIPAFNVPAPDVHVRGPGIPGSGCEIPDPTSPFVPREIPIERVLRGGGCTTTGAEGSFAVAALLLLRRWRRQR